MARQVPSQLPVVCISTKGSSSVEEDVNLNFFTEKTSRLIYEVRFYEGFVIVRPASPDPSVKLRQVDWGDFLDEFEEYWGDKEQIAAFVGGYLEDDEPEEVDLLGS